MTTPEPLSAEELAARRAFKALLRAIRERVPEDQVRDVLVELVEDWVKRTNEAAEQ